METMKGMVEREEDNGTLRLPSRLDKLANGTGSLEENGVTGDGIFRAKGPRVTMTAEHHIAIWLDTALHSPHHIPDRRHGERHVDVHVNYKIEISASIGSRKGRRRLPVGPGPMEVILKPPAQVVALGTGF